MRKRWQKFYEWWSLTRVLGASALVFGFVFLVIEPPISRFLSDIAPEFFGIGVTVLLIDWANERRSTAEEKAALILQMGSDDRAFAVEAARILRQKEWLMDGSLNGKRFSQARLQKANLENSQLQGVNLESADLEEVRLINANLHNANLSEAKLKKANLYQADLSNINLRKANLQFAILVESNLQNSDLEGVDLQKAKLHQANLKQAILYEANLKGADLSCVNLCGADLTDANLRHVNLYFRGAYVNPICDENTIMPDGSYWTPDRDWREFTHPDEWAAEQAKKRFAFSRPPGFARDISESKS